MRKKNSLKPYKIDEMTGRDQKWNPSRYYRSISFGSSSYRSVCSPGARGNSSQGRFSVALAGGSTPEPVYAGLAQPEIQTKLAWNDIHFFFGDERYVLPDHPDLNFRMVQEALFSKVDVPEMNVHRVRTELNAGLAAFDYETRLKAFFLSPWPRFDLVLLGMGYDGHTASLFPTVLR